MFYYNHDIRALTGIFHYIATLVYKNPSDLSRKLMQGSEGLRAKGAQEAEGLMVRCWTTKRTTRSGPHTLTFESGYTRRLRPPPE